MRGSIDNRRRSKYFNFIFAYSRSAAELKMKTEKTKFSRDFYASDWWGDFYVVDEKMSKQFRF